MKTDKGNVVEWGWRGSLSESDITVRRRKPREDVGKERFKQEEELVPRLGGAHQHVQEWHAPKDRE